MRWIGDIGVDEGWDTYCENCDNSPNPDDYTTIISGYEERYVCPNCGFAELPGLSEASQLMGDYLLSVADDDWTCGFRGALPPIERYIA